MTLQESLDRVAWIPVWVLVGGAVAVLVFSVLTRGKLRMIGTTAGALCSVAGGFVLTMWFLGVPFLMVLVGWSAFLATVVARVSSEAPRLKFILSGIVLLAPLGLLGVFLLSFWGGSAE